MGRYGAHCAQLYCGSDCPAGVQHLWRSWHYGVGGRIVRSFTVAATVLPAFNIYGAVGTTVLAVVSCLLSILILLVLLPYLSNAAVSLKPTEKLTSESPMLSPQERLNLYAQHCSLTPRETEVLEKLLTTEDGVQETYRKLPTACISPGGWCSGTSLRFMKRPKPKHASVCSRAI